MHSLVQLGANPTMLEQLLMEMFVPDTTQVRQTINRVVLLLQCCTRYLVVRRTELDLQSSTFCTRYCLKPNTFIVYQVQSTLGRVYFVHSGRLLNCTRYKACELFRALVFYSDTLRRITLILTVILLLYPRVRVLVRYFGGKQHDSKQ